MFQLDSNFLDEIGLRDLPNDQKRPFLQHIYEELELRVGTRLSDGLSDEQLEEFESIIDHKEPIINAWLEKNMPQYSNDPLFVRLQTANKLNENDINLRSEYVATKWLEVNRSDYRNVVSQVLEELKKEISDNKAIILGNTTPKA